MQVSSALAFVIIFNPNGKAITSHRLEYSTISSILRGSRSRRFKIAHYCTPSMYPLHIHTDP